MNQPFGIRRTSPLRVLLVNPPSPAPVSRRFCGTQAARGFLYPPLELAQLGAVGRKWHRARVLLIDAIAQDMNEAEVVACASRFKPDVVVAQGGFSTFRPDAAFVSYLKSACPGAAVGAMGYLVSRHARRFLEKTGADFVLVDEPELQFSALLSALEQGREPESVDGLVWRSPDGLRENGVASSIDDLDQLPFAAPDELDLAPYRELLQPTPMWSILSSRGCPFACTFCVTTYGKTARFRSVDSIVEEVQALVTRHGIRSIRFTDDTFTLRQERTLELCERLAALESRPSWTALTRLDTLDDAVLSAMRAAGCRRLDVGIESGSQRILDTFHKGLRASDVPSAVARIRAAGLEALGFFIVGSPGEDADDVKASVDLAIRSNLDYVVVSRLQSWTGTPLSGSGEALPAGDPFDEPPAIAGAAEAERTFYRSFYFRPGYVFPRALRLLSHPVQCLGVGAWLMEYVLSNRELDYI